MPLAQDRSLDTCWPVVQRAPTVPRMPPQPTETFGQNNKSFMVKYKLLPLHNTHIISSLRVSIIMARLIPLWHMVIETSYQLLRWDVFSNGIANDFLQFVTSGRGISMSDYMLEYHDCDVYRAGIIQINVGVAVDLCNIEEIIITTNVFLSF